MLRRSCRPDSQCLAILIQNREAHRLVVGGVRDRTGDWKLEVVIDISKLIYMVCLKSSVNGIRKQTKQKIQIN